MERDERTSSMEPAGVRAMACTHRRPDATREPPAVIAVRINWQLARDRPGRMGWRRGSKYRGSRVTPVEGNPPVRFDEREQETEPCQTGLRRRRESAVKSHREITATAPVLDSTRHFTHDGVLSVMA